MRREEKRRKFHEALLNTLYPPEPQQKEEEKPVSTSKKDFHVNLIPDDYGLLRKSSSSTSDDNGESEIGQQKLTRAQRKRLRKKKLKEDISRRKQVIGPLLPSISNDSGRNCGADGAVEEDTPGVRQNADETHGPSSNQSKLKQRRMAKRLARKSLKSSNVENCVENQRFPSPDVEISEKDNHSYY